MAKVGLDSFSYHLHLEDADHPKDTLWFLERTRGLGLSGCSFSPQHLSGWEEETIRGIGAFCTQHDLYLELTSGASDYARLCRRLILASQVGCRMLRTFISDINADAPKEHRSVQLSFTVENLRRLGEVAECVGVILGIGNRGGLSTAELVDVLKRVDSPFVRASFCNAEVMAMLEDPVQALTELAPHVSGITLKDWCIWQEGETSAHDGCALGQGQAKVSEVYETARRLCAKSPITLEIATLSPVQTFASLEEEESRVRQSVEFVRSLDPDRVPT